MATNKSGGKNAKKIFDVTKPGQSSPDASSKPVIIGHKPLVEDPMVKENVPVSQLSPTDTHQDEQAQAIHDAYKNSVSGKGDHNLSIKKPGSNKIKPSAETVERVEKEKATGESSSSLLPLKSALPEGGLEDEPKAADKSSKDDDEKPGIKEDEPEQKSEKDMLGGAKSTQEAETVELEREEKINQLAESGEYHVKLGSKPRHPKNRGNVLALILVLLLVMLALVYVAIDSGFVKSDIKLPFDLIKNSADADDNPDPVIPAPKTSTTNTSNSQPTGFVLPTDWQWYENKDLGFKFAYPKSWGSVSVQDGEEAKRQHLIKGSEKEITFSSNTNVTAGIVSKDWEHDPAKGHGGLLTAASYSKSTYEDLTSSEIKTKTHIHDNNSILISTEFAGIGCLGVGELLISQLKDNTVYPAVAFLYYDKKYTDSQCDENALNLVSELHIDELKQLGRSIVKF